MWICSPEEHLPVLINGAVHTRRPDVRPLYQAACARAHRRPSTVAAPDMPPRRGDGIERPIEAAQVVPNKTTRRPTLKHFSIRRAPGSWPYGFCVS
jgi:hypothetical protein